jgi:hypothetical protein
MARTNRLHHLAFIDARMRMPGSMQPASKHEIETIGLHATISLNAEGKKSRVVSLEKQD